MPNEISVPEDLQHLLEKREQEERRLEQRRGENAGATGDRREASDRRQGVRRDDGTIVEPEDLADEKLLVKDFWDEASCGEKLYMQGSELREQFANQLKSRYELEPYIPEFAEFDRWKGQAVLEIGVGLGADHQKFAEGGANLHGVDLTPRAITNTHNRFDLLGLKSELQVADAEDLPFDDGEFDMVYSWGVIHHSPETPQAAKEIHRILKPGGQARVMIYHTHSFVGYMLWVRYGLMRLRPFTSLATIYANHLESPGTKAYSVSEAKELFGQFGSVQIDTVLTHADLLTSNAGQRHEGGLLSVARKLFPGKLVKSLFPKHGLFMLVSLVK